LAKHQFVGTSKSHSFFDRRVHHLGKGRGISVTKFIPKEWEYVRIEAIKKNHDSVIIRITKLMDSDQLAQATQVNTGSEQDA
jgi:hypothetical protein